MQTDVNSVLAAELVPLLTTAVTKETWDNSARLAVSLLADWDFQMNTKSPAASLFEVVYYRLLLNIFEDELDSELLDDYLKTVVYPPRALRHIVRKGESAWIDDIRTESVETLDDIVARSLRQALAELHREDGSDPSTWTWGRRHTLTFNHVLGRKRPLDRLFNIGAFPVGGNHLTVNMAMYHYHDPFDAYHGASQRMIVDLASPQTAWHVLPTGQSGLVGNAHYRDQTELYINGKYRTMRLNRADTEQHTRAKLVLTPAPSDQK
jgi:penicillin amidase